MIKVEIIEDKEEYLVIKIIKTHNKQNNIPNLKDKTKTIPK